MTFLIKIDRRTLKKNPNAGSTVSYIRGAKSAEFKYKGTKLPEYLKDKGNCYITEIDYQNNIIYGKIIGIVTQRLIKQVLNDRKNCTISMEQDLTKVEHLPEPDYFYEYRKTKVQCDSCGAWFDHHKLRSDEIMDVYSDRICPECGEFDCCQLKFESL